MKRPASVLDGFFTDDVASVAAAARALRSEGALEDGDRSWGRVKAAEVVGGRGRAPSGGLWSDAIFGPRRALACNCGKYAGAEHEGVTCEKCGVLVGDPSLRAWRFGHIECPPLVHPLLVEPIANALGMDVDDVRAIVASTYADDADDEDLLGGLVDAIETAAIGGDLADAAIVARVPVPPPGDRPLVEKLTPEQLIPWMGPVNAAWCELVVRTNRRARLIELGAPPIILANEARMHERALADVIAATRAPPSLDRRTWWTTPYHVDDDERAAALSLRTRGATLAEIESAPPLLVPTLLFLDERTLLLQVERACIVVDVDGVERFRFPSPGPVLASVHGSRVLFDGGPYAPMGEDDPNAIFSGRLIFDVATLRYLHTWPDDIPATTTLEDEPEDLRLVDLRTGETLDSPWGGNDRPELLASTRDGRYVWLGSEDDGGVLDVVSGIPQIEPSVALDGEKLGERLHGQAVGLAPDFTWRFVHATGEISDGFRVLGSIDASDGAAFSPDCSRIATFSMQRREVVLRDVTGARIKSFRID